MLDARRPEVAQKLGDMFIAKGSAGFEFDDQAVIDKKIGEEISEWGGILIEDADRMLLQRRDPDLLQAVGEPVLIDLFSMSVPQVGMQRKGGFTDLVAQLEDGILHKIWLLRIFAANSLIIAVPPR